MSRPRFLADEDLRNSIVQAARRVLPEVEFASVVGLGWSSANDEELLQFAWDGHWLIISHDVNTMRAFAESRIADGRGIRGLFLVPQTSGTRAVAECLVTIWEASEFEEWQNRIVYLPF